MELCFPAEMSTAAELTGFGGKTCPGLILSQLRAGPHVVVYGPMKWFAITMHTYDFIGTNRMVRATEATLVVLGVPSNSSHGVRDARYVEWQRVRESI